MEDDDGLGYSDVNSAAATPQTESSGPRQQSSGASSSTTSVES